MRSACSPERAPRGRGRLLSRPTGGRGQRRVVLVSASAGLYPWLSVPQLLEFFRRLLRLAAGRRGRRYRPAVPTALPYRPARPPLSHAQHRPESSRALARALSPARPCCLRDEPRWASTYSCIRRWPSNVHCFGRGQGVILTTHRPRRAERLCEPLGLLHRGKLVFEVTLRELLSATCRNARRDVPSTCHSAATGFATLNGSHPPRADIRAAALTSLPARRPARPIQSVNTSHTRGGILSSSSARRRPTPSGS